MIYKIFISVCFEGIELCSCAMEGGRRFYYVHSFFPTKYLFLIFIANVAVSLVYADDHTVLTCSSVKHTLTISTGICDVVFVSEEQKWLNYCLLFNVSTNHSIASSRPVPLVAEVLNICHFQPFKAGNPSEFAISEGVMACSMSCLFANTTKMAFLSSSS